MKSVRITCTEALKIHVAVSRHCIKIPTISQPNKTKKSCKLHGFNKIITVTTTRDSRVTEWTKKGRKRQFSWTPTINKFIQKQSTLSAPNCKNPLKTLNAQPNIKSPAHLQSTRVLSAENLLQPRLTVSPKATVQLTNKFPTVQSKTFPRSCNLTKATNHW